MDKYNNIKQTAPSVDPIGVPDPSTPYSQFDLSCISYGNINIGTIFPIDLIECIPHDKFELGYSIALTTRNPLARRLLSGMRCYTHTYYMRNSDLWRGWNNFITKGRSGTLAPRFPVISPTHAYLDKSKLIDQTYIQSDIGTGIDLESDTGFYHVFGATPMSLYDALGLPLSFFDKNDSDAFVTPYNNFIFRKASRYDNSALEIHSNWYGKRQYFNALPFAMYQSMYLNNYANRSYMDGLVYWQPDNPDEQILPYNLVKKTWSYDGTNEQTYTNDDMDSFNVTTVNNLNENVYMITDASCRDRKVDYYPNPNGISYNPYNDGSRDCEYVPMDLRLMRFRQFKGDYFTASSPYPDLIRGSIPELNLSGIGTVDATDLFTDSAVIKTDSSSAEGTDFIPDGTTDQAFGNYFDSFILKDYPSSHYGSFANQDDNIHISADNVNAQFRRELEKLKVNINSSPFTLKAFRELQAYTIWCERNGRTDGSYNEMIKSHFGWNPNAREYAPTYIGGFYQDVVFDDVVQTTPTADSQLGRTASRGISANGGHIGSFTCPDYGWIMTVMSIVPDTIYTSELAKHWQRFAQDENYFPEFNALSPQGIKRKELFTKGLTATQLEEPIAFTERFAEMKSRRSSASGLIRTGSSYDNALVLKRDLSGTPNMGAKFLNMCPQNIDLQSIFTTNEVPFDFTVVKQVRAYRPLPYNTVPDSKIL